ncbi:techylectin-like protein [Mytilus trossulus]|uniref:techylectin-like protein n=1 Tax=Mytilus trossulus TaxID=6551 RepID=UPI003005E4BE
MYGKLAKKDIDSTIQIYQWTNDMYELRRSLLRVEECLSRGICKSKCQNEEFRPKDCSRLDKKIHKSGVFKIFPDSGSGFKVYCDMDTDSGHWTVFQHRTNSTTIFNHGWTGYKNGFCDINAEFWLGDSLAYHNDTRFSTKDNDNDKNGSQNCASVYTGSWWFGACHYSNLNGVFKGSGAKGINWYYWRKTFDTIQTSTMMIRNRKL